MSTWVSPKSAEAIRQAAMQRWDEEGERLNHAMRQRETADALQRMIAIWQQRAAAVNELSELDRANAEIAICEARRALRIAQALVEEIGADWWQQQEQEEQQQQEEQ